jgi:hypothetical protein
MRAVVASKKSKHVKNDSVEKKFLKIGATAACIAREIMTGGKEPIKRLGRIQNNYLNLFLYGLRPNKK